MRVSVWGTTAIIIVTLSVWGVGHYVHSAPADEIREQIESRSQQIERLEREIAEYEAELEEIGREKRTLQSSVRELELSQQKLSSDINLTEQQILEANQTIQTLQERIETHEEDIAKGQEAIAGAIRAINKTDSTTLVETILAHERLSDVWNTVDTLQRFQESLRQHVQRLEQIRSDLATQQTQLTRERQKLAEYQAELVDKREIIAIQERDQQRLLAQTRNEESEYQAILQEKQERKEQFLQELRELESQLQFEVDRNALPSPGSGVLSWPVDDPSPESCWNGGEGSDNCITQYFGNTTFSQTTSAYNGNGHNGIDFRASVGTKIRAALSGTVIGTGNTDQYPGCYSYGKWVLIRHNNGLTTLYAHLSLIRVKEGQHVGTGDVIGYSGNTGYSTGPHLHFTVYASDGVRIMRLGDIRKITNCGDARIPVADLEAYLNPLSYL